jgi:hypothetical protein
MNLRASHYSGFNADNEAVTLGGLGVFGRLEGARRETRDSQQRTGGDCARPRHGFVA